MERFARGYEEIDTIRLTQEEHRELLSDHFQENAHWADKLSERMDRLERYVILSRMYGSPTRETIQIEGSVSKEHIERTLREELTVQKELMQQYQKNINKVNITVAKYGETVPLMNELENYQTKTNKAQETINRIVEQLKE